MSSKNVKFVLIGAKATGKTMFIACLENGTKEKINAVGNITRDYINDKWNKLNKKDDKTGKRICKLPPTPAIFKPLQFMYQHNEFGKIQFSTHDYDGNFTETITVNTEKTEEELKGRIKQLENDIYTEIFSKDESSKVVLKKELARYQSELSAVLTKKQREELLQSVKEKPKGVFFFLPYEKTTERFQSFSQNIGKFIELAQFSNKSKSPIPACIVITKWDDAEGFQKKNEKQLAREYLERNEYLHKVLNMVENYFEYVEISPVSSCESYNLTAPFDFGLEKTFEQWYERVLELKKEKKFEKLITYMANRYEDMQFVKKYDFRASYEEVQNEYFSIVEKAFYALDNYEGRKKYLDSVASLFKTKLELLEPLKKALKSELRRIKIKKVRNTTLSIVAIVALGMGIVEYKMKLDVDEAYASIKQRYEKKVLYPRMEMAIQKFLENYKSVNFLYAWANVPKKRTEVLKMRDNLKVQYKKWLDNQITEILTNKKLSSDEKRLKLKELRSQADTLDQRKIDEIMANLGLSINKEKWLAVAKDCLKTCEGETGRETIATLVSQVKQSDVILDSSVKGLLNQLSPKKVSIIEEGTMERILAEIEEQSDANKLTAFLSDFSPNIKHLPKVQETILIQYISFLDGMDIGQILSLFPSMESNDEKSNKTIKVSQTAIPNEVVASDRYRNALVLTLEEKYKILQGNSSLDSLRLNRDPGEIQKNLTDIKKKIDQNTAFYELSKKIQDASFNELGVIEFGKYNNLNSDQIKFIKTILTGKLNEVVDTLLAGMPDDDTEIEAIELKIEEIELLDGYTLKLFDKPIQETFTYHIPKDKNVTAFRGDLDLTKKLKDEGISDIRVTLIDQNDEDPLGFECNGGWDNTDIDIEAFGIKLKGSNDLCNDADEMTYDTLVTLKEKRYKLIISEDDMALGSKPVEESISIGIEELKELNNGDPVPIDLPRSKLKLRFINTKIQ